jgi:hypothetical protein
MRYGQICAPLVTKDAKNSSLLKQERTRNTLSKYDVSYSHHPLVTLQYLINQHSVNLARYCRVCALCPFIFHITFVFLLFYAFIYGLILWIIMDLTLSYYTLYCHLDRRYGSHYLLAKPTTRKADKVLESENRGQ